MWERTKRLINSYLDGLIDRVSRPAGEAHEVTRAEIARLTEVEAQAMASVKMLEKELAETELKAAGLIERERILRERGDDAGAARAASELRTQIAQRDLLRQHLGEANAAVAKAHSLRELRRQQGAELANESYLTPMRENIAGLNRSFSSDDPAATIDEMRSRLAGSGHLLAEDKVAEADRQLEAEQRRTAVEDILARYKQGVTEVQDAPRVTAPQNTVPTQPLAETSTAPHEREAANETSEPQKSLGPAPGKVNPID